MPELPEVQTIVSDLNKVLPGLSVRDFWCDSLKLIKLPKNSGEFKKNILDKKILEIRRIGKNILIYLSGDFILLVHQKMTGHLLYGKYRIKIKKSIPPRREKNQNDKSKFKNLYKEKIKSEIWEAVERGPLKDDSYNQHIHFVLGLSDGMKLALSDVRKFAKIILGKKQEVENLSEIKDLGPEPFHKNFDFKKFKEITARKNGKIKPVLMDQKNISGIGNIYGDEILWEAGVNPLRTASSLSESELQRIFKAIKKVLTTAIKARGDSMSDYRRPSGEKGNYQNMQKAYKQTGKPCKKNDGGIIKRIKIAGRSAHFCPVHQR